MLDNWHFILVTETPKDVLAHQINVVFYSFDIEREISTEIIFIDFVIILENKKIQRTESSLTELKA